jgi:BclB C-terminal domain-containing protein
LCNGAGGIIPYASGPFPVILLTTAGGLADVGAVVGFGGASTNAVTVATPIVITELIGEFAFTVPRNITLISLWFDYTNSATITLVGATEVIIQVQLYQSPLAAVVTNNYVPLSPPLIATGTITGPTITPPNTTHGNAFANIKVAQGTRLLLVVSITAPGATEIAETIGGLSAGLAFS